jgi:hypothetical protein
MSNYITSAEFAKDGKVEIKATDIKGGKHVFLVDRFDYELYCTGHKIQDCFPYLTADQREILISGIPSDFWEEVFDQKTGNSF